MPHSALVIPSESARHVARKEKSCAESAPPQNRGVMRPRIAALCNMPLSRPMGSLSASFIPAGRLGTAPLSPRASLCRIGPRRQGFASPLRALDGSGPIRKTRCLGGERGGRAVWTGRKEPFGHTGRLEPQPWGAVTRRAVAQRRSRASGLTRLSAEAIRGFGLGFCRSVSPVPPRFSVSLFFRFFRGIYG